MKKEKINLCFFSGDITRSGGTERVSIIIANELCKNEKYNVSFLSLEERREESFYEIDSNITTYKLYAYLERSITHIVGIIHRLIKFIKKSNIDVLVDIDGILDLYSLPAKLFTGVKVISWEHFNFYQNPFVSYRKVSRRMAAKWADAIVTLTEEDKGYYNDNLKIKCPIQCIYNPVIWDNKEHYYNKDSRVLLSVGRLTYQKGFDMLVEVAKDIMFENPQWKWIILGEGEDRALLENKISEYNLQEQVILKGNVNNVGEYYENAAIFVMTSRFEGLPMTLLETKPYKLPIVSFRCKTGPAELVEDGENGYLVEMNVKAMGRVLTKLMHDDVKRVNFSKKALMNMEKFNLQTIIKNWNDLLQLVMNNKKAE